MVMLETSLIIKYTITFKTSKTYQEITCGGVSSLCSLAKTTLNHLKYSDNYFAILSMWYLEQLSIPVSDILF